MANRLGIENLTLMGMPPVEYVELAGRMQKGVWGPFSREEESAFLARAKEIWDSIKGS